MLYFTSTTRYFILRNNEKYKDKEIIPKDKIIYKLLKFLFFILEIFKKCCKLINRFIIFKNTRILMCYV